MPFRTRAFLGAGIAAIALAAAAYAGFVQETWQRLVHAASDPQTYTVEITNGGFVPERLVIWKGDTVTFVNRSDSPSQPASDPHPTHESYGGFDPTSGIKPGSSWSFRFEKSGVWHYHDHLGVGARGEITVRITVRGGSPRGTVSSDACGGECFDELVRSTVETDGIDAAYRLFQDTYEKGELPRTCHWTAHQIGEAAYEMFKHGKDFPITDATTYCGYGFYHGFLEGLLRENPDPDYALSFCAKVEEKLGTMGLWNCYHGIGHGFTEDPPRPETEGNFNAMIKPGIEMCEFLFGGDFRDLNLCLTGVFTVPAGFAEKGEYGLSVTKETIFKYCTKQPYKYQKACYGEFAPKLDTMLEWDVRKLVPIVESLDDDKLRRLVTWVVPSVMVARDIQSDDFSGYIDGCRDAFSGNLREICWGGMMLGIFTHGEPEKQHEQAFLLCDSGAWKGEGERRFCWGEGLRQMRANYPLAKVQPLCAQVPAQYRSLCLDEKHEHTPPYDDPAFD
jgi:plastocyanin